MNRSGKANFNGWLAAVLFLALAIRVVYLWYYSRLPEWDQLTVDNYYHLHWAESIASGNIFGDTTYFRAPFYVFCLGLLFALFGASLWVSRIFGIAVGLASIFFTYLIGQKMFNKKVGLTAALIHALFPLMLYFEAELLLDPLFTLLLQVAIYHTLKWYEERSTKLIFLAGVWFGLASITRPTALVFLPLLIVVGAFLLKNRRQLVKQSTALLIGAILFILPIFIRNIVIANDPVLIASQGGINFYIGNHAEADGVSAIMPEPLGYNWRIQDITYLAEQDAGRTLKASEVSRYWFKRAWYWISHHPKNFITLYLKKLYRNFSDREISNNRDLGSFFRLIPLLAYNPLSFGIVFIFAVLGIILTWHSPLTRLLVLMMGTYILVTSLFFFSSRFRLPMLPFYFVFASAGLLSAISSFRKKDHRLLAALGGAGAAGLLTFIPLVALPCGSNPLPLLSKGRYYFTQGNYRQALEYNRKAFLVDSTFADVNLNIGACFLKLGEADSSRYYFEREKRYHPRRNQAYLNLASWYFINSKLDSAYAEITTALSLKPYDITAQILRLRIATALPGISNDSLRNIVTAARAATNDDIYLLNEAAYVTLERGDTSFAETLWHQATLSTPPPIETDDEAFTPTFRTSPQNWSKQRALAYSQLGYLSGLQGEFQEAVRLCSRAIREDSLLAEAYINLISGYLSLGKRRQADSVLSAACTLFPTNQSLRQIRTYLK